MVDNGPRDLDELTAWLDQGKAVKYLHFWGHRPNPDGSVGKGCLSQWWPTPFTLDGRRFASAEHYMMWRKAELFNDPEIATRVLTARTPAEAKDLGRRVRGFDDERWTAARYEVVLTASIAKFGQNPELRRFLLSTRGRVLVEASPLDRIWGIGLAADDARAADPKTWLGLNLLGFALGEARAVLSSTV
ncbi:NADAR family protein [Actinokineospora auranticolor]|uniref:NADAR domain-containing protein n=1 Tax=Actinokineospora auranticolor TaxID=155976 RepID=A0A2S6GL52_9PSEU|nr:NADAR family protein [Actinokineospora auranticolor]PPK65876.1 hypothetical protein CLV40_112138 [Actinokineospora auranticolor]